MCIRDRLFILRWFWWRINALTEIVAMVASFLVALVMELWVKDALMPYEKLVAGIFITTVCWLATAWLSKPTDHAVLVRFVNLIRPYNFGWQPVIQQALKEGSQMCIRDSRNN